MTFDWLTARPIAHRGLHDARRGVIENTASAFAAAISGSYGIETDLQISADGVFVLDHGPPVQNVRPAADKLLASMAPYRFPAPSTTKGKPGGSAPADPPTRSLPLARFMLADGLMRTLDCEPPPDVRVNR